MTKSILLALALTLAMLAGCTGVSNDPDFTVPKDAPSHQDAHEGEGYTLRVKVTNINGTPIQGAAVVFFTGGIQAHAAFEGDFDMQPDGQQGARPRAEARAAAYWAVSVEEYDLVAGARTGADGIASADLEPGKSVHVAAGDVEGMTTEMRPSVTVGGAGEAGTVALMLYPTQRTVTFEAAADALVVREGPWTPGHQNFAIPFDEEKRLDAGFHQRLHSAQITLTWSNEPVQGGDLYVGLAVGADFPFVRGDDKRNVGIGEQTETMEASSADLEGHHSDIAERKAHAAVVTDYAGGGIDGLPVAFEVQATFMGSDIRIR